MSEQSPLVGVVMGSKSDFEVMRAAVEILREFGVAVEARVVRARAYPVRAASETAASRRAWAASTELGSLAVEYMAPLTHWRVL